MVEPLRIGGNIRVPRKLKHSAPEYPGVDARRGAGGHGPDGGAHRARWHSDVGRVLSADVHPEFARDPRSDAVSQWVFSPTLLNGEAVDVRMAVSVRFSLQD